jgi:hypothetical protein
MNRPGRRAIEGLLPERVFQAVYGREVELVSALTDGADERRSAHGRLKKKLLEEFMSSLEYTDEELKPFAAFGRTIAKALS